MVRDIRGQQEGLNAWVEDKLNKADNASQSGPLQPLVDVVPKNIFRALSDMAMLRSSSLPSSLASSSCRWKNPSEGRC